ncbi:hypothetical protein [Oceanirhabdus sp. W0125-5]|uniref:hypothetical protein n=1 Tax=Oceanirhabdus sp. W0125-5 TaxID=2999116 RepID=UPI0022F30ECA|nr:hypothetical protein [Oceanirhabdus sp. W0125-5]WBW97183.1 hypothetical protein OW730_26365 [Oceanirhabdus sp. W0125-5]
MKKIIMICITLLLSITMIGCTNNQESNEKKDNTNQDTIISAEGSQKETSKEEVTISDNDKNTVEYYAKLIGLGREEIIDAMEEEPTVIDEGGLEFSKADIRVWFIEDGKTVDQIFTQNSEIDFNGAKIGGDIEDFKKAYGEPTAEDAGSAYSNFDYESLVLHVQYDSNTGKVIAVYLMKEWK